MVSLRMKTLVLLGGNLLVVTEGRERYEFDSGSRVALMVRWLATQAARLSASKLSVTFDCAGSSVSAELRERERLDPDFSRG